jgi:hypothetical protein
VKVTGKRWVNLPQRAGAEPLYMNYQMRRVDVLLMNLLAYVSQVVHGIHVVQLTTLRTLSNTILQTMVEK